MAELVAYAKKNPGKVRYTSAGVGSFPHFDMEIFARRAGVDMIHIPNKTGAAGMINDLVVGDAQTAFLNAASGAAMIKAGKLRPIAVLAEKRLRGLSRCSDPGRGRLSRRRHPALAEHARARQHAEGDRWRPCSRRSSRPRRCRSCRKASPSSWSAVKPSESLDEAQTWLNGEIASWRKITSEVKIDLTD